MPNVLLLLDSDTLSEVIKGRDLAVQARAQEYLLAFERFRFSVLTRYEILRGLRAKQAERQIALFELQCQKSDIVPLTDAVIERAAGIYGELYRNGRLISDADILIAATALVYDLVLVTENRAHYSRIRDLRIESWRTTD